LSVESFGLASINTGGKESIGPPVGGMILAQEYPMKLIMPMQRDKETIPKILFIAACKHKVFLFVAMLRLPNNALKKGIKLMTDYSLLQ